jgi:endonuclease/exonuclease/phosphatase family metal-dependent hydrolase
MTVRFARIYSMPAAPPQPPREFGVAILSRFPVTSWANDTLTRLSTQEATLVPTRMPGLLEASVDVRGTIVRFFDTHLDYRSDPGVRRQQVDEMIAYLGSVPTPTVVPGDLNATPDAPELRPLLDKLTDVAPTMGGAGLTYPSDHPAKRIDYVLSSMDFRVRAVAVPATVASDHRPVVVDLSLDAARRRR